MTFESFVTAHTSLLWAAFLLAVVLGAVANKTSFCTMGAVSDWVNIGDLGRLRAWLLAIAVAMLGVVLLESAGLVSVDNSYPAYRAGQLIWAENLLGGLLFGVGMTLASGCGNKTLVRMGTGNFKSVMVFLAIAVIAYFMVEPFPGSDQTLYSLLFFDWIRPLAIATQGQDLGSLIYPTAAVAARLVFGLILAVALLVFIFRSVEFRRSKDNILGGLVVGLIVLCGWYVSSTTRLDIDGEQLSLVAYAEQWDFLADADQGRPAEIRPLAPQSFTFINPVGQSLGYVARGFDESLLSFGIVSVLGVVLGSFIWALMSRSLRFEWFTSLRDFLNHILGGVLMGFGGILALGCTIGQGITGVSTLALGSFLTLIAIVFGSAVTMKTQYYRLVYEEEASILSALVSSLVDMKCLPRSWRRLASI